MWIRKQLDTGAEEYRAQGNSSESAERVVRWDYTAANLPIELAMGRGVTNTAISYIRFTRTDGTFIYMYIDTGTTVVTSATQP